MAMRLKAAEKQLILDLRASRSLNIVSALVAELPVAAKPSPVKPSKYARVPCAYNAPTCAGRTFLPNGSGSTQHTSCVEGQAALAAAKAAKA